MALDAEAGGPVGIWHRRPLVLPLAMSYPVSNALPGAARSAEVHRVTGASPGLLVRRCLVAAAPGRRTLQSHRDRVQRDDGVRTDRSTRERDEDEEAT